MNYIISDFPATNDSPIDFLTFPIILIFRHILFDFEGSNFITFLTDEIAKRLPKANKMS